MRSVNLSRTRHCETRLILPVIVPVCGVENCREWRSRRGETMGSLDMTIGTHSETGWSAQSLAQVTKGCRELRFRPLWVELPPWRIIPRVGVWALLHEECHSCPESGQPSSSGRWLEEGSDQKVSLAIPICSERPFSSLVISLR